MARKVPMTTKVPIATKRPIVTKSTIRTKSIKCLPRGLASYVIKACFDLLFPVTDLVCDKICKKVPDLLEY
jgi:hypothetical protein